MRLITTSLNSRGNFEKRLWRTKLCHDLISLNLLFFGVAVPLKNAYGVQTLCCFLDDDYWKPQMQLVIMSLNSSGTFEKRFW